MMSKKWNFFYENRFQFNVVATYRSSFKWSSAFELTELKTILHFRLLNALRMQEVDCSCWVPHHIDVYCSSLYPSELIHSKFILQAFFLGNGKRSNILSVFLFAKEKLMASYALSEKTQIKSFLNRACSKIAATEVLVNRKIFCKRVKKI